MEMMLLLLLSYNNHNNSGDDETVESTCNGKLEHNLNHPTLPQSSVNQSKLTQLFPPQTDWLTLLHSSTQ
jgi:hypothetical protein